MPDPVLTYVATVDSSSGVRGAGTRQLTASDEPPLAKKCRFGWTSAGPPAHGLRLADTGERWLVLDGAQRLAAPRAFTDRHLVYFPAHEGGRFGDLKPTVRTRLLETQVRLTVLRAGVPGEVVCDVCRRINHGQDKEILAMTCGSGAVHGWPPRRGGP
ncbi:hypothetical protein GCM10009550_65890 [Actinocorallia libanotica]|uniref:Uncharacterized protein n=1 Tax=Actinocorallia libanotica TaxID=46162 RepID=A0ABP4CC64_9ACTN